MSSHIFLYVFILGCASFFYHHGEQERLHTGILWGAVSLGLSLVALEVLGWGFFGCILAQGLLFIGATLLKMGIGLPRGA